MAPVRWSTCWRLPRPPGQRADVPSVIAAAFILLLPVELPDKMLFVSLVLATRFPPLSVFVGVGTAFGVQVAIAVAAGSLLSLLPEALVTGIVAVLFLVGAIILWRSANSGPEEEELDDSKQGTSFLHVAAISFGADPAGGGRPVRPLRRVRDRRDGPHPHLSRRRVSRDRTASRPPRGRSRAGNPPGRSGCP